MDEHLAALERKLDELRSKREPLGSITNELERIGEQTASILVVAHDQAHETTRVAQEQAERCVADAAANAVAMREEAKQRLGDLDNETDAIWRERERLLEDVRVVSAALPASPISPPPASPPPARDAGRGGVPAWARRAPRGAGDLGEAAVSAAAMPPMRQAEPQAAEPFSALEESGGDYGRRPSPATPGLAGGPGAAGPARLISVARSPAGPAGRALGSCREEGPDPGERDDYQWPRWHARAAGRAVHGPRRDGGGGRRWPRRSACRPSPSRLLA